MSWTLYAPKNNLTFVSGLTVAEYFDWWDIMGSIQGDQMFEQKVTQMIQKLSKRSFNIFCFKVVWKVTKYLCNFCLKMVRPQHISYSILCKKYKISFTYLWVGGCMMTYFDGQTKKKETKMTLLMIRQKCRKRKLISVFATNIIFIGKAYYDDHLECENNSSWKSVISLTTKS